MEYWEAELRNRAPSTRRNYKLYFNKFIKSVGVTPEQLYEMQRQAERAEDPRKRDGVAPLVKNYMHDLMAKGMAPGTARFVAKAVRSFLDANKLELKLRKWEKPAKIYEGQRIITKKQIRQLYAAVGNEMKARNQALIMFMKDSGLRASDVAQLKVEDYLSAKEVKNDAGERFKVFKSFKTLKTGHFAHVIIGPEAVEHLDRYIGDRRTGPLFLARGGGGITAKAIINYFVRMKQYLEDGYKVSGHSFRKLHWTALEAKMSASWIRHLQGKAVNPYSRPSDENLIKAYMEAYDQLRVFTSEVKERLEVRRNLEGLQKQLLELRKQQSLYTLQVLIPDLSASVADRLAQLYVYLKDRGLALVYTPTNPTLFNVVKLDTGDPIEPQRLLQLDGEHRMLKGYGIRDLLALCYKEINDARAEKMRRRILAELKTEGLSEAEAKQRLNAAEKEVRVDLGVDTS